MPHIGGGEHPPDFTATGVTECEALPALSQGKGKFRAGVIPWDNVVFGEGGESFPRRKLGMSAAQRRWHCIPQVRSLWASVWNGSFVRMLWTRAAFSGNPIGTSFGLRTEQGPAREGVPEAVGAL